MNKLLIIGNGFDLKIGLKTSYLDFYKWCLQQNKFSKRDTNIFFSLLQCYHDDKHPFWWKDVEMILYTFLIKPNEQYVIDCFVFLRKLRIIIGMTPSITSKNVTNLERDFYIKTSEKWLNFFTDTIGYQNVMNSNGIEISSYLKILESKIYDFLIKELNDFENTFKEYIKTEVNEKNLYPSLASKTHSLLSELLNLNVTEDLIKSNDRNNVPSILSFNYTRPGILGFQEINFRNIHGTIWNTDSEIIFGIDDLPKELPSAHPLFKFTKIYRISLLEQNALNAVHSQLDLKIINEIIIYGHSLNHQDQSYYFALFNSLKINDSDVKIKLCYSNYPDSDGIIKDRAQDRVIELSELFKSYEELFKLPQGLYRRMTLENRVTYKIIS